MRRFILSLVFIVAFLPSCCNYREKKEFVEYPFEFIVYNEAGPPKIDVECSSGKDDSFFVVIDKTAFLNLKLSFFGENDGDDVVFNIGIVMDSTSFNSISGEVFFGNNIPSYHEGLYTVTGDIVWRGDVYNPESGWVRFDGKQSIKESGVDVCEWSFRDIIINVYAKKNNDEEIRFFAGARNYFLDK